MDLDFYKQYEERFRTAINSDYSRGLSSSQYKELVDRYKADTGRVLRGSPGCSRCVMTALKEIGKFYFSQVSIETPFEKTNEKTNGRRGRNKKA